MTIAPPAPAPVRDRTLADRLRHDPTRIGLVPYLMAGHPNLRTTRELGRRLACSGAAAIELGVPHGDALADGPVIRRAGELALRGGTTVAHTLELAADIAGECAAPVVLMTYVNPVLAYGPQRFAEHAAQAGVAAVIVPDLPVDEAGPITDLLHAAGVDTVFVVGPGSPDERLALAAASSTGFVYCATVAGVTGTRSALPVGVAEQMARARRHTALPLAAGFGISRPEHVRGLRGHADLAVVGSAIVAEIDRGGTPADLVRDLLEACR